MKHIFQSTSCFGVGVKECYDDMKVTANAYKTEPIK